MRRSRALPLILVPLLLAAAVLPASLQDALRGIQARSIRAHLAFLADDLLEGRAPGSRGAGIAARYIAAQLERAGVEPIDGRWFQPVPLIGWTPDPDRTTLAFTRD